VPVRSAQGLSIVEDLLEGRLPQHPGLCPGGLPESLRPVVKRLVEKVIGIIEGECALLFFTSSHATPDLA
jgi:hypothetical protein